MSEHCSIKIHFTMDHREAQESPLTEIARVLNSIQMDLAAGDLFSWSLVQDMRGLNIGEYEISISEDDE